MSMNCGSEIVCFTIVHPVLLDDIEKCSRVKWAYGGLSPTRILPNFKFVRLALWSNGTLTYFRDPEVIRNEWKQVEPEDFLEKCRDLFPIEEV